MARSGLTAQHSVCRTRSLGTAGCLQRVCVCQCVICIHVTALVFVTPRGQVMHHGRCSAPHVGFMENEHGDLWKLQLVEVRQRGTGSRRTAENNQVVQRRNEHNTLSNGSTLSLGQLITDAYNRTAIEPKTARAVPCGYLDTDRELGTWQTHRTEK